MILHIGDIVQEVARHLSNYDIAQLAQCSKILRKHVNTSLLYSCKLDPQIGKMCLQPMQLLLSNKILLSNIDRIRVYTPFQFGKTLLSLHIALTHPGRWLILCRPDKIKHYYKEYRKCFPKNTKLQNSDVLFLHSAFKAHFAYAKSCENINIKVVITTRISTHWINNIQDYNLISVSDYWYSSLKKQIIFNDMRAPIMCDLVIHNNFVESFLPESQVQYFRDDVEKIVAENFHTVVFLYKKYKKVYRELLKNYKVFNFETLYAKRKFEVCTHRAVLLVGLYNTTYKINADAAIIVNLGVEKETVVRKHLACVQCAKTALKPVKFYIKFTTRADVFRASAAVELYYYVKSRHINNTYLFDRSTAPNFNPFYRIVLNLISTIPIHTCELDAFALAYGHFPRVREYWHANSARSKNTETILQYFSNYS